eukprot:TRINITY_DN3512_c0_g1_i1.p1 TRINITY_DN3512_c0_g1~~TRINITY_DN3512_c0_g1_i1.p1  ORF type:complete len:293 (-),score=19.23 TRINITY_DN3512_c0_g1_i1:272-1150(-)
MVAMEVMQAETSNAAVKNKMKMGRTVIDSYNATVPMAPRVGFGTADRPALLDGGDDVPGPGAYAIKSTMFKNPRSCFRSPPCFSIRGREKFGSPDLKACDRATQMEPGPAAYKIPHIAGSERQPPAYSFPRSSWAKSDAVIARDISPGPGTYALPAAVGKQVLSTKRSHSGPAFGTGGRPPLISVSTDDIGPGDYEIPGNLGTKQVDSRKTTHQASRFAKPGGPPKVKKGGHGAHPQTPAESHAEDDFAHVPGAGAYNIPSTLVKNPCSMFRSPPVARMSGREKFGSPFVEC